MATDKLIFPIGFDLEKAVADAEGQADKLLRRLETTIKSRPLAINLKITNAGSGSINEINTRMREIVKEWNELTEAERVASKSSGEYTVRAKQLIAEFVRLTGATESYARSLQQIAAAARKSANEQERNLEKQRKTEAILKAQENTIANITAKLQHWKKEMNSADMGTKQFRKAAEEVKRLSHNLAEAQRKVNSLTDNFRKQDTYISRLIKRLAVYAGYQAISNFVTSVREVTAEFELQRISLGAIIQDQAKANQLFSEIKNFALKSPVKILDLTKYTKQLAAYKFETKELFDWTKRLTDISVGLGVSMDRIILLAGQIRATGYLRGCLGYGTTVKMWDGATIEAQNISVGDILMGDDETPRAVKKLYRGVQRMYVVDCGGGKFRCNEHHILTLYNTISNNIEDVYVFDYLKSAERYKGVKRTNGNYEYCDIHLTKDTVDNYYGFEIDGNKRFIIEDNIVTHNSEVRQATEAGIPIVEEVTKKLEELNGRAYTTAEVMNLISERAISWEMVADIFKDMTSAGGMFYDMQEKQGNTLYGMWQKLSDAAAVMYEEIGNTESINSGMKKAISSVRTLMLNWKQTGAALTTVGVAALLYANRVKLADKAVELSIIAESKSVVALKSKQAALTRLIAIQKASTGSVNADTVATKLWTAVKLRGAQAANLLNAAVKGLTAALAKNIWGIAILGLSLLIEHLWLAEDATEKLKNKLSDIKLDYEVKQGRDASNFEDLANAAVEAAKGSKTQKEALDELRNTYGKIIPLELLTIENLERMKGNYGELVALIDEYNLKQKYEAEKTAIQETYAASLQEEKQAISDWLRDMGASETSISHLFINLRKAAEDGTLSFEKYQHILSDFFSQSGLSAAQMVQVAEGWRSWLPFADEYTTLQGKLNTKTSEYLGLLRQQQDDLKKSGDEFDKAKQKLNEFSSIVDDVMKKNEDAPEVTTYDNVIENEKARLNNQIGDVANGIIELFKTANAEVDSGTQQLLQTVVTNGGMIPSTVWDILEDTAEKINNPRLLAAIQSLRSHYQKLAPDNETVNFVRSGFIKIVNAAQGNMQEYRQYLYDGSMTIKEYQDFLQKSIQKSKEQAFEMIRVNALIDAGLVDGQKYDEATIEALQKRADVLQSILDQYVTPLVMPDDKKTKDPKGSKSDDRLSKLQEMERTLTSINTKYDELKKKEGETRALEYVRENYKSTLEYVNKLGKQFKLNFAMPTDFKDLQTYRKNILDVVNKLKMKGYEKAAIELELKIAEGNQKKLEDEIQKQLKELTDKISRTKTAKEFYEKILNQTGDVELAANVSLQIYGSNGRELDEQMKEQFRKAFELLDKEGNAYLTPEVSAIIDRGAYEELRDYITMLPEAQQKAAEDLVKAQQQMSVKQYEQWLKDLQKAQDFADKRIELSRYTATQIAAIEERIATLNPQSADFARQKAMLEKMIVGYRQREQKEAAKIEYDMFKDMPIYVQMFDDLDNASSTMLNKMLDLLKKNKQKWGEFLDPSQLKEMQTRMNEVEKQLAARNPFKTLSKSYKDWIALKKSGRNRKADEDAAAAAIDAEAQAMERWVEADKAYQAALKAHNDDTTNEEVVAAKKSADKAEDNYKTAKDTSEKAQEQAEEWKEIADAIDRANSKIDDYQEQINKALDEVLDMMDAFGVDATDMQFFRSMSEGFNQILDGAQSAVAAFGQFATGHIFSGTLSGVGAITGIVSGISSLFSAGKVRRANKEIKKQQELLDKLEYSYSRLEKAMDKAFGSDYVSNYKAQIRNLEAQAAAYQKQAEAERSKGKKADEDKIKEYEEAYRSVMDEIADMQGQIAAQMLGTDLTSAARDFAQAWLDAYKEFSKTSDAMSEKFQEMVENMVVESLLARVMQRALEPMFNMIDEMNDQDFYSESFWQNVAALAKQGAEDADAGAQTLMKFLEAAGISVRDLGGDLTGISRDIASASEESINGLAAGINTQNFYIAKIHSNVAAIAAGLGATSATAQIAPPDYTPLIQQSLENQAMMVRYQSEIVSECRAIASECRDQNEQLKRVIVAKNAGQSSHCISVKLQ